MKAIGIDVSLVRRLDVVALADSAGIVFGPIKAAVTDIPAILRDVNPDVVAIDSPPQWGTYGKSRPIEKQLRKLGINIYSCPTDPGNHPFYAWMREGFKVFDAATGEGFGLYRGGPMKRRQSIEVFPHASAVVLRGSLAPAGMAKFVWRRAVLEAAGIDCSKMRTTDHLDAALAALTGLKFLTKDFSFVGTPGEAVLVLPIGGMPTRRYVRDQGAAILGSHAARRSLIDETSHACACGCGARQLDVVTCQVTMRSTSQGF